MIKVSNISKTYSDTPVFSNVSFTFSKNEVIGLVGENGQGKSTLMRILAGDLESSTGVVKTEGEAIGYMPQEVEFPKHDLVGEFIESKVPIWEKYKFDRALRYLEFHNVDEYQKINTLSGGEQTKLCLASLMVEDPTLLLLDEPTNHLDVDGLVALQDFLIDFKGKTLVISHDRAFLDAITSRIYELEDGKFKEFVGIYSNYIEQKERAREIQQKSHANWLKKKEQFEKLIVLSRKIGKGVGAAKKRYEREVEKKEVKNPYSNRGNVKLNLSGETHSGKHIVTVDGFSKSFGSNEVIRNVSFEIRGNEKIWLYGKNGSGKSTILKAMVESIKNESSQVFKMGNNLKIGYYSQTQEILNPKNTLEDEIQRLGQIDWLQGIKMLGKLKFAKKDWDKKVSAFSFGQKARLIFGAFSLGEYNFLILDEPTNHLDIRTREVIESALINYKGAMLIVSHDRYFVQNLNINKILFLEDGRIVKSEIL